MNYSRTDIPAPDPAVLRRNRRLSEEARKTRARSGHGPLRRLPRPVYGHIDSLSNTLIPRRHRHIWAQLSYATQGHLQVWTPYARFVALPQRAVWIPAGVLHRVQQSPHTVIRSLYLDADALGLDWLDCRVLAVSPLLHELIRHFSTLPIEYDLDGPDGRLAQVLADQLAVSPDAGLILPWPTDPRLQSVCQQLQRSPDDTPDLGSFSRRLGVSDKTLTRLFQQQTGLGFRLWRQRVRLVHALPLLERGDRITDVALACGYDSLSSFIAAFRAHTGVTPRAFAAGAREDDSPLPG
ncbi:helix-turn-helix transcriptional regulator [Castellaniella ginsengisoli]|jgi:AraC-like DNA-binding protein|uniref:Helix-turn-helix transcriptional regulator n=1 Tax=Castellaniella ginsengisoli TaxID=546114 RepID=A0AB39F507_9BURK